MYNCSTRYSFFISLISFSSKRDEDQSNAESNLHISSPDPWDDKNNEDQENAKKNVKLLTPLKGETVFLNIKRRQKNAIF